VNAGHVFAQSANFCQALGLSHLKLELQPEELVIELALLVFQLGVGQVSDFFYVHLCFSVLLRFAISSWPLAFGSQPCANTAWI
jgi:hypothetical protein